MTDKSYGYYVCNEECLKKKEISYLILAINNGDKKAFKLIYDLYERKLFTFIQGYTKNEPQTKDILQETFIKLWDKREYLEPKNSIKSYLFKTAYNTYIDKIRRKESEQNTLEGWRYKKTMEVLNEYDETIELRIKKVRQAVDNLPNRCKEIFLLSKYQGFKYSEISEILDISVKTIQAQIVKAYKLIREEFK